MNPELETYYLQRKEPLRKCALTIHDLHTKAFGAIFKKLIFNESPIFE